MMNLELKNKWLAALRSGEYKQATDTLYNPCEDSYCCLGVLAHVNGSTNDQLKHVANLSSFGALSLLASKNWFIGALEDTLVQKNDELRWSFQMIADWIEANVEPA